MTYKEIKLLRKALQLGFIPEEMVDVYTSDIEGLFTYIVFHQIEIKGVVEFLKEVGFILPSGAVSVSFDYDLTLDRKDVQDYCEELLLRNVEVYVTTFRYNQMLKHLYPSKPYNTDLFRTIDKLGIKIENIVFTNMRDKSLYLKDSHVLCHLDDDLFALEDIKENTEVIAVNVEEDFKTICDDIIQKRFERQD